MRSRSHLGRRGWMPLLLLLGIVLLLTPDAMAQSRRSGRSGTSKRVEKQEKEKAKPSRKVSTPKTSQRRQSSSKEAKSRSSSPRVSRSTSSSRTRTQSAPKQQSRSRSTSTNTQSRSRSTQRSSRATTSSRGRSTQQAKPRQERSRVTVVDRSKEQSRSRSPEAGRSSSRSSENATVRSRPPSRNNDRTVESSRTRSTTSRSTTSSRVNSRSTDRGDTGRVRTDRGGNRNNSGGQQARSQDRQRVQERSNRSTRSTPQTGRSNGRVDRSNTARRDHRSPDRDRVIRTPNYHSRTQWRDYYEHNKKYRKRHYQRRKYRKPNYYKPFIIRPRINNDIRWPRDHRQHHGWRPRYRYRQVVYVNVGWGQQQRRSQIDVRTYYYHELRYATDDRAEVDVYVERVELYEDGRYLGTVDQIPESLGRTRATVYRNGDVRFDRDIFVIGDSYAGFELVSTRFYNDFVLDAYRSSDGLRVGKVDLGRGRVVPTSYSRLFDTRDFQGYVPVSLLPEDHSWLLDYGTQSFSGAYYEDDPYYYGGYDGYGEEYQDTYYGDDYYEEDYYEDDQGRPYYSVQSTVAEANFGVEPLTRVRDRNYTTSFGASIHLKREAEFVRVK